MKALNPVQVEVLGLVIEHGEARTANYTNGNNVRGTVAAALERRGLVRYEWRFPEWYVKATEAGRRAHEEATR